MLILDQVAEAALIWTNACKLTALRESSDNLKKAGANI